MTYIWAFVYLCPVSMYVDVSDIFAEKQVIFSKENYIVFIDMERHI